MNDSLNAAFQALLAAGEQLEDDFSNERQQLDAELLDLSRQREALVRQSQNLLQDREAVVQAQARFHRTREWLAPLTALGARLTDIERGSYRRWFRLGCFPAPPSRTLAWTPCVRFVRYVEMVVRLVVL